MEMRKNDDKRTVDVISNIAFRLFIEKGYEATNLREIGAEAGINASTIYFYYKSKKELFLDVYNNALRAHTEMLREIAAGISLEPKEESIKEMFIKEIEMIYFDSASYKFLLRYRMFPVSELINEISEISQKFDDEEFQIWKPFLSIYADETEINERVVFIGVMKFINGIINEMLISGQAIKTKTLEKLWEHIHKFLFANGLDNLFI